MAEPRYGTLTKQWGPHPKDLAVTTDADAEEQSAALLVDPARFEALVGYGYLVETPAPKLESKSAPVTEESLRNAIANFFHDDAATDEDSDDKAVDDGYAEAEEG